jgi:predicted dehydrogenase
VPGGEEWGVEPPDRQGVLRRGETSSAVAGERGRWDLFYPAVLEAVRGGTPMPVDPRDAVAVLELLEAARRSAATRSVVHPIGAPRLG